MDIQDIYDKVVRHLGKQGKRSVRDGRCAYRCGKEGELACAAGCLIDDEHYSLQLEGCDADSLVVLPAIEASLGRTASEDEKRLIRRLQTVHDEIEVSEWPAGLRIIGAIHYLQTSVVKEAFPDAV